MIKGNSPFTSFTRNSEVIGTYGDKAIEVDLPALRQAIRSGEVKNVAILAPKQIEKLIERDTTTSDFWKNKALSWTKRDSEYLIKGEIPKEFFKIKE